MAVAAPPRAPTEVEEAEEQPGLAALPPQEVYAALDSSPAGLTTAEAQERLRRYGPNVLREVKETPLIFKLLANFTYPMALLLWAASGLAFLAGLPELGIAILAVIFINAAFSFFQEYKAEKAVEALKELLPTYARVIRDNQEQRIPSEELVPGDVVVLSEGDAISADARVVEEFELRTNNSTLTGESAPVRRTAEPSTEAGISYTDRPNLVFAGTSVATGSGRAVVIGTGANTAFGRIAQLTQTVEAGLSPLQIEVGRVTRLVTISAVSIGVTLFVLTVLLTETSVLEGFIFGIGIVVAFVPEGLLPLVTLSLAVGVQRMARRNALIKKLSAVETLGSTTVIGTDKTGTLTQNEMTVQEIWLPSGDVHVSGVGYEPSGQFLRNGQVIAPDAAPDLRELLAASSLASNARLLPPDGTSPRWSILGDPTEGALVVAAAKFGLEPQELNTTQPRLCELPFESVRKRMSTVNQVGRTRRVHVKGAPSEVLAVSTHIAVSGREEVLDEGWRQRILAKNDEYARQALRVLAVAYRPLAEREPCGPIGQMERGLVFLGLEAMYDPPRPEVAEAVRRARKAQIRIIMITGDYGLTAEAIARRVGIVVSQNPRIVSGAEVDRMSDEQLKEALTAGEIIFARVTPEHKLRVVSALKDLGQIVAVTGDGVNDAPALKRADIGIAMGITGTDVAKEASVMILADDNFASIVNAIEEGRGVYADVKKFITYIFASNVAAAVPFLLFILSGGALPLALTVLQVLAVDLGTDMVPALGLGVERPEPGVMERPPRSQQTHLIDLPLLGRAWGWLGLWEAFFGLAAFFYTFWVSGFCCRFFPLPDSGFLYRLATTMTLSAIVAAQIGNVYAVRTERKSSFDAGLFSNRLVNIGVVSEIIILLAIAYLPPLQSVFDTEALSPALLLALLPIPIAFFFLEDLRKYIVRRTTPPQGGLPQEK